MLKENVLGRLINMLISTIISSINSASTIIIIIIIIIVSVIIIKLLTVLALWRWKTIRIITVIIRVTHFPVIPAQSARVRRLDGARHSGSWNRRGAATVTPGIWLGLLCWQPSNTQAKRDSVEIINTSGCCPSCLNSPSVISGDRRRSHQNTRENKKIQHARTHRH